MSELRRARLSLLLLGAALVPQGNGNGAGGERVDFRRQIRPILSDRCFPCHGNDEVANRDTGGLRLDSFAGATEDLGGYAAIVPGDPEASELVRRVRLTDDERMPPPDTHLSVSAREIELFEQWIAEGAEYSAHWSFVPARRVAPPAVADVAWPRDALDRFVLARLEAADLAPAPEADRESLLRSVTFDLTGLPPSPDEIDAFLADGSADAYERVVDRLLASPRFGERMAVSWLDLARYADTYGYQNDVDRRVWPWRDWVIRAYNQNLPFDRFLTWQLAGDLLPDPTRDQRLATTFNRLHRQTNEGGSVEEEYRIEYVADRVNTFGMAFLGLTLECARCHDHKFDPIRHEDYYRFSAFFDDIDEAGLYSHFTDAVPTPALLLTSPEDDEEIARLRAEVDAAESELAARGPQRKGAFDAWLAGPRELVSADRVGHYPLEAIDDGKLANLSDAARPAAVTDGPTIVPGRVGNALELDGENNATFPGAGELSRSDPFTLALWLRAPQAFDRAVVLHRSRAWTDAGSRGYQLLIEDGRLSASLIHFWPGNALRVRAVEPLPIGQWVHVAVVYDGSSRAAGLELYVDGVRAEVEVVRDALTKKIVGGGEGALTIGQRFRDRGFVGGRVDELSVFHRRLTEIELRQLADGSSLVAVLARDPADWSAAEHEEVFAAWLSIRDSEYRRARELVRSSRRALDEKIDAIPEIMTMAELGRPRPAYLLERGRYDRRAQEVVPAVPALFASLAPDEPANRLGLAHWLTDPDHPLTARVALNHLWQRVFRRGLVATPEDFGSQGAGPTHPDLLDFLARELVDSGWDQKAMLRRLVLSATYRQSARASDAKRRVDPENELLSRGPRARLSSEEVRDAALFASGLLAERIGGPSAKPYQPAGLWKEKSGRVYERDTGAGLYRRSLYTFWKRTSPPPAMMIFDSGKREVCVARRASTSTPLQVLVLWNDPQFVEAARKLAERVLREAPAELDARTRHLFRLLATRAPDEDERRVMRELVERERAELTADPADAEALLAVGDSPVADDLDPIDVAAWALAATTVLSSDAALMNR